MFFRESNPVRFRPYFGVYGDTFVVFPADGTFVYCQLADSVIANSRPSIQPANGTFVYCSQDISQFNRMP